MSKARFHVNRVFYQSNEGGHLVGWYFETREGVPQGPFTTREEARTALVGYLADRSGEGDKRSPI